MSPVVTNTQKDKTGRFQNTILNTGKLKSVEDGTKIFGLDPLKVVIVRTKILMLLYV